MSGYGLCRGRYGFDARSRELLYLNYYQPLESKRFQSRILKYFYILEVVSNKYNIILGAENATRKSF